MKLLRFLLFPFAILYDLITSIRNWCFDVGILKSTEFDIPVIVVGNLSVGGTGKTPQIEYLIRLLKDDYVVAVLSRGYKRKTNGFIQLNKSHTAEDVGDEPLQFFKKYGNDISVAVDANRTNGIQQLLKNEKKPEVVLLDDAFQHRKVKATFYILLTKYDDLYANDFLLPTGNLRESRRGAKRAEVIIVTKCPTDMSKETQEGIRRKINPKENQQLFFTTIDYDNQLYGSETLHIDELQQKEVVLVTGIANPNPLLQFLSDRNVQFQHLKYPDHHHFSENDINKINSVVNRLSTEKKVLLTTEKDYVRLSDKLSNLLYIKIESKFLTKTNLFDSLIKLLIKK